MEDLDGFAYFQNKRADRGYLSSRFRHAGESMRFLTKVVDSSDQLCLGSVSGETVIHVSPGERQEIKALFCEDDRGFRKLILQKFNRETGKALKQSFSFDQSEVEVLRELLDLVASIEIDSSAGKRFDWASTRRQPLTEQQKRNVIRDNPELVEEALRQQLTTKDIVALGYRKSQVEVFRRLLESDEFFQKMKLSWRKHRDEDVWQHFFESNKWIFGHSLGYVSLSSLDGKKLEQVVAGFDFASSGKRVDALMKTRGIISSLCFVEIKKHTTPLIEKSAVPYREGCWPVSQEISGSLAQVQGTVDRAVRSIQRHVRITSRDGTPTGEEVFHYRPRAFLIVGSLSQFRTPTGINTDKHSSFELWRHELKNVEVITFDELFMRAEALTSGWDDIPEELAA